MARYNIEMGPPLFAPLLVTTVGGTGLSATVLRREDHARPAHRHEAGAAHPESGTGASRATTCATRQLWAGHVHGEQSTARRRRVLDHLRAADERVVVVANAKLLTEGVDIPGIDAVCFLHPRSPIDTIQAVGRALRRGDRGADKAATIIVPVLLGPGEDPETALSGSAYATVFAVVRALAAHDDSLAQHLDRARRSLGSYTEPDTRRGLPQWLTFHGIDVPPGFAHAITVRAIRESTDSWAEYLAAAATYRTDNGGSLRGMPRGWTTPRGLPLWRWLQSVKERYREGRLSPEQITDMEALGIVWNPHDHAWRQFVTDLKAYLVDHPDLDVPTNYTNPAGRNLGQTVADQRPPHRAPRPRHRRRDRTRQMARHPTRGTPPGHHATAAHHPDQATQPPAGRPRRRVPLTPRSPAPVGRQGTPRESPRRPRRDRDPPRPVADLPKGPLAQRLSGPSTSRPATGPRCTPVITRPNDRAHRRRTPTVPAREGRRLRDRERPGTPRCPEHPGKTAERRPCHGRSVRPIPCAGLTTHRTEGQRACDTPRDGSREQHRSPRTPPRGTRDRQGPVGGGASRCRREGGLLTGRDGDTPLDRSLPRHRDAGTGGGRHRRRGIVA